MFLYGLIFPQTSGEGAQRENEHRSPRSPLTVPPAQETVSAFMSLGSLVYFLLTPEATDHKKQRAFPSVSLSI